MINLNYRAWIKVARTLASHASLSVKYVSEERIKQMGAQAWTDGRNVYLREPSHKWDDKQFRLWLYFLLHEIGHNTQSRRGCFELLKRKKPSGMLAWILNLLEDHVQERELYRDMPALRHHLSQGRAHFYEYMLARQTPEMLAQIKADPRSVLLFSWDTSEREFMPDVAGWEHVLAAPIEGLPNVDEWRAKLQAGDYADVLRNIPSLDETYELAERILREVFDEDPEQQQGEPQPQQGEGEQGEKGEAGNGQGQGEGQQGADGGQGEPSSGEGKGDAGAAEARSGEGNGELSKQNAEVKYTDLMAHDHSKDMRNPDSTHNPNDSGGGLVIDYTDYFDTPHEYGEFLPKLEKVITYELAKGNYPDHDRRHSNGAVPPSTLSKRVGRYMQAQSKNKRLHGQKSGNLSGKNLYRLKIKEAGEARKRVFNRRVVNKSKDVAVCVGIDMSGSMSEGNKSAAAIAAVTHLHDVISKQLQIPLEVLGFSNGYEQGLHVVVQSFDKVRRNEDVEEDMRRVLPFRGANRDGEFLLWARDRLLSKRASRHIMIILSDGQPRCRSGDVAKFTKEVTTIIDADPRIELHAIGILSGSVRHFYSSYDVIQHAGELEEKLLTVLRNKIITHI